MKKIFKNRIEFYNDQNLLHREDGPAIEYTNGTKLWYKNDQRHREDGPAIEYAGGDKHWYKNGLLHRENGPAIEYSNGDSEYARIIGNYYVIFEDNSFKFKRLNSDDQYIVVNSILPFNISEDKLKKLLIFI